MGSSDAEIDLSDRNSLCETELVFHHEPSLGFSDRSVHTSPQHEFHITSQESQIQDPETKSQETRNWSCKEGASIKKEDEEYYCKTPTRSDQILPAIPSICPPAPRKPKRALSKSLKVRNSYRSKRMIILNVSREIDFLFNQTSSLCNKFKKARHI